ncbi:MAG: ribose 5-phosphate isomerase B [Deltaproteobacteria bacterium]|nr:ribose 5-phosphate isomerase B [Deltaproteobacteria bacterium]
MQKTIYLGSDHAGFSLKEKIKEMLISSGYQVIDKGCFDEQSVDYPVYAGLVAKEVINNKNSFGILICGSGIGMSITANKYKGIRCALCHNEYTAEMSRRHNDANVLALGARVTGVDLALAIVRRFISTEFEGGRHQKRLDLICEAEKFQS